MTSWRPIQFDRIKARQELAEFSTLLRSNPSLTETEIRDFVDQRPHFVASIALLHGLVDRIDRWAPQLDLAGKHVCDYVVGSYSQTAYSLIEFEDAAPTGVFKPHPATPYLTDRFNHGFSQIVDWLCLLDGHASTPQFQAYWGRSQPEFLGLLVIGRNALLEAEDRQRLKWRSTKIKVNSFSVLCLTYDDLVLRLIDKLELSQHESPTTGRDPTP